MISVISFYSSSVEGVLCKHFVCVLCSWFLLIELIRISFPIIVFTFIPAISIAYFLLPTFDKTLF
jgi:hypothetical protein